MEGRNTLEECSGSKSSQDTASPLDMHKKERMCKWEESLEEDRREKGEDGGGWHWGLMGG